MADLLTLEVFASVAARLDDPSTPADDAVPPSADDDAEGVEAGALTLAIDVASEPAADAEVGNFAGSAA